MCLQTRYLYLQIYEYLYGPVSCAGDRHQPVLYFGVHTQPPSPLGRLCGSLRPRHPVPHICPLSGQFV